MTAGADAVGAARQRILKVEYEFPSHVKVSRECRDLLAKILVPDPTKRMTIPVIQRHPWYLKDLPPGVAEMNDTLPQPSAGVQACPRARLFAQDLQGKSALRAAFGANHPKGGWHSLAAGSA